LRSIGCGPLGRDVLANPFTQLIHAGANILQPLVERLATGPR
jgi:hypothetical protein